MEEVWRRVRGSIDSPQFLLLLPFSLGPSLDTFFFLFVFVFFFFFFFVHRSLINPIYIEQHRPSSTVTEAGAHTFRYFLMGHSLGGK